MTGVQFSVDAGRGMPGRLEAHRDDSRQKVDGDEEVKREGVAAEQIEEEPAEDRADRIGGEIERIGQAVDAAQRAAAEKVRP